MPNEVDELINALPGRTLNEVESSSVFRALGLNGPEYAVLSPDGHHDQPIQLNYPLVAKLVSHDLPHKSEYGAIKLGLRTKTELDDAIVEMKKNLARTKPNCDLEAVLVQEMAGGLGEAIIGMTHDPLIGPTISVGIGGVLAEIYKDIAVRPAPIDVEGAKKMIEQVRGFAALRGYRGKPKGDLSALAEAVAAVSLLALNDQVLEAELNPVAVHSDRIAFLDALIRLKPAN